MKFFFQNSLILFLVFSAIESYEQNRDSLCQSSSSVPFSTDQTYLTIWNGTDYTPLFIKGVNLGVSVPGTYPGELAATRADYGRWFQQIREAGFNTIRIYTLHFPRFYEVLDSFNLEHPQNPLLLIQGIWLSEGDTGYHSDLYSLTDLFTSRIEEVVDCIHGNREIAPRFGEAYGVFSTDVSLWTLAYIIGREVYPVEILTTDALHHTNTSYSGEAFSIGSGSPSESWITSHLDKLVVYERQNYHVERPVSFSSWPTLDPIDHPTETGDEDTASIRLMKIDYSLAPGGLFISYHAYPYYPDFISEDPGYQSWSDYLGPNSYLGYLMDLKTYYQGIPLIIAEYGTSSSWGIAHYSFSGMHHGGDDEIEQGNHYIRMMHNILESGCGGGVAFAWIDEWFKRTWITDPLEDGRRALWHNVTAAEQNFGLIGFKKSPTVFNEWESFPGCAITRIQANADYAFFGMRLSLLEPLNDLDTLWIALDTYDASLGESILPDGHQVTNRAEFAFRITNYSAELYVTKAYDLFGIWHGVSDPDQLYRSIPSNGGSWGLVRWKNNQADHEIQYIGRMQIRRAELPPSSEDGVVISDTALEIRIPWTLIQFIDPSTHTVMHDYRSTPEREDTVSDGIAVSVFHNGCSAIPSTRFTWPAWDFPLDYEEYKKTSYGILEKELPYFFVPAIAMCDEYAVGKNKTLVVEAADGLLHNDYDADGGFIDAEFYSGPSHGNLSLSPDGSFDYIPVAGFSGLDEFSYVVFDGYTHSLPTPVYIHVENNEGIFANLAEQFSMYPNPANEEVVMEFPGNRDRLDLKIVAVNGSLNLTQVIHDQKTRLDVSRFPAGIYLISLTSSQETFNTKLVVY